MFQGQQQLAPQRCSVSTSSRTRLCVFITHTHTQAGIHTRQNQTRETGGVLGVSEQKIWGSRDLRGPGLTMGFGSGREPLQIQASRHSTATTGSHQVALAPTLCASPQPGLLGPLTQGAESTSPGLVLPAPARFLSTPQKPGRTPKSVKLPGSTTFSLKSKNLSKDLTVGFSAPGNRTQSSWSGGGGLFLALKPYVLDSHGGQAVLATG